MNTNINWDISRSRQLLKERGISFEDIVFYIKHGGLLDRLCRPLKDNTLQQCVLVVNVGDYIYLVPYTETGDGIFLHTITPSRQATQHYLVKKR